MAISAPLAPDAGWQQQDAPRGPPAAHAQADNTAPRVSGVNSSMQNGTYALADTINVTVGFDEPVVVRTGQEPSLSIALDGGAGRAAPYASGNGTALLGFAYTVQYGDTSDDLDYGSTAALTGGVWDAAGNAANLTLPSPGGAGSLSRSADILVDYAAPRLVAADSVHNGDPGYHGISNALYVDAFHVENRTYAVASSQHRWIGMQMVRIHENGTLSPAGHASAGSDSPSTLPLREEYLFGARGITVGGNSYLVVTACFDRAVLLIRNGEDGALSVADVLHSSSLELNCAAGIDTFEMDGGTYALVTAFFGNGLQLIRIHGNGTLEAKGSLGGTLGGPNGVDVFDLNGRTHALVSAWNAGGVQLIRIHGNGTLDAVDSLLDAEDQGLRLGRAYGVAAFDLDGRTYALVGSEHERAVQLIRIHGNGTLEAAESAVDDSLEPASGFDSLNDVRHVTHFSLGGGEYALAAAYDDNAVQMIRVRGGDAALLPAGSAADGRDGFERIVLPTRADVFALGGGTYAISQEDVGGGGLQLMRLSPAPFPASVTSPAADGVHGTGFEVDIAVQFDDNVRVAGPLEIRLNSGGAAVYRSGNNTDTLVFRYTVLQGERAADLEYAGAGALQGAGTIADARTGFPANRTLPPHGSGRSLGDLKDIAVDGSGARQIASVGSPAANGTYRLGEAINITVAFDAPVRVAGEVELPLNSGGAAGYLSGNNTDTLVFRYTVRHGEQSAGLDHTGALAGSGTIANASNGAPASRVLPPPGTGRSLGDLKDIAVDARPPSAASVASADGAYGPGGRIDVAVRFDEPVAYSGADPPVLHLNVSGAPRPAAYASGNGTDTLGFAYAVQAGDRADDLDYYGAGALSGSIADLAGNPADRTLPPPGSPGSLGGSHDVLLDSALPQMIVAGRAEDGIDEFDALGFSVDADALAIGGTTYVVVAALENAVQLARVRDGGGLEAVAEARDGEDGFAELDHAHGVDAFFMGGRAHAIVAAERDDGVQLIRIQDDGTLKAVDSLGDDGPGGDLELDGAVRVAAFELDGSMHALVASRNDDGVQLIRVHENGTLEARGSLDDDGTLKLDGAYGLAVFDLDGRPHALVSGHEDDGVQLVRMHDDGTLEARGSLADSSGLELGGPRDIAAFDLGGLPHALVASRWDDGIQLIRVHENGTLSPAGSAAENTGGFDELRGAYGVDAFDLGGRTYALVASRWDDGIQLVRVRDGDGAMFAAGSAADGAGGFDELAGAFAVDAFAVDGRAYAIVASGEDRGIHLIELSPVAATSVTSATADGTYPAGATIDIAVAFDAPVRVAGDVGLPLNSGGAAEYLSGSGRAELVFRYTVRHGEQSADLDHTGALAGSGTIDDAATGLPAGRALPPPGTGRSLGDLKNIAVDARAPSVASVASTDGAYAPGSRIDVAVRFDEPVVYSGAAPPVLMLNVSGAPRPALYASGNDTDTLHFAYEVQVGDRDDDLDYYGAGALSGSIAEIIGNPADLSLPLPGSPGSLGHSSDVLLDPALPRMVAADSAHDGDVGFPRLAYSLDAAAIAVDGATYVAVPSLDDAVSLVRVHGNGTLEAADVARDGDPGFDELWDAYGVDAFFMGGAAHAIVASEADDGVQLVRIHGNGTLEARGSLDDSAGANLALHGAVKVAAFKMNGSVHALVTARGNDNGVQLIRIHGNGTLEARGSLDDDEGDLELDGAFGVAAFDLDGSPHALVSGHVDNGVQLIRIHENGTLEARGSLADDSTLKLRVPRDIAAFDLEGRMHALVASQGDNGAQLVRVHKNGTLSPAGSAAHGAGGFDELYGAHGVDAFSLGGHAYALVAAREGNGVQLIRVRAGDGALLAAGSAAHGAGGFAELEGGHAVDAFFMAGRAYAIVATAEGGGIQLIGLSPPAAAANVTTPAANGTYPIGDAINITVAFDAPVNVTGTVVLRLNSGGAAEYVSGNGTAELVFRYTVRPGEESADLDYADPYALYGTSGASITEAAGIHVDTTLPPPGAPGSLGGAKSIAVDGTVPRVVSVSSPAAAAGGAHPAGSEIRIDVEFSEAVAHPGGPASPGLSLNTGGGLRTAPYASGNGTDTLTFVYAVRAGDRADRLAYTGTGALAGGALADLAGNPADLTLPQPGSPLSLSGSGRISVDAVAPRVLGVSSATPGGTYGPGATISVAVRFSEPVVHSGSPAPALSLDVGGSQRQAAYASGNDTDTLTFAYEVRPGDRADRLAYHSASALSGAVADRPGNRANLTLPQPGSPGSLSHSSGISVDTAGPSVLGVMSATPDGAYREGRLLAIAVAFDEPVVHSGSPAPALSLDVGGSQRQAAYASGNDTDTLTFAYEVRPGDRADRLDYAGRSALSGAAADRPGNRANLTLPQPGSPGSLSASSSIRIDTERPRVLSVGSPDGGGPHGVHARVNITVAFSEPVFVAGAPELALNAGGTAAAHARYASGNGTAALTFRYSVGAGHLADSLDYASSSALSLGEGGAIADEAGNRAELALPDPGSPRSLGGSASIEINATGVTAVTRVTSPDSDGAYGAGSRINITVAFSDPVVVEGSPRLGLDVGAAGRHAAYVPGAAGAAPRTTLEFLYTVQPGDNSGDLDYASATALDKGGGSIADDDGGPISLLLPSPGEENSLGYSKDIEIDTAPPEVASVFSPGGNRTYGVNGTIEILVRFGEPVGVAAGAEIALALDAGAGGAGGAAPRHAAYAPRAGAGAAPSADLRFLYAVQPGDGTDRLAYAGRSALSADAGAVTDGAGNPADLALPQPGSEGSLSASSPIRIDTERPSVVSVGSPDGGGGTHGANDLVNITVAFSEPVLVAGIPALALGAGAAGSGGAAAAQALYASGSGTGELTFRYSVVHGHVTERLGYAGTGALSLGDGEGGAIADEAGNPANLTLPSPGSPRSLGGSSHVRINATGTTVVTLVTSPDSDGAYGAGSRINITVAFSDPVVVEGSPRLELDVGAAGRHAAYVPDSGAAPRTTLGFQYTVRGGDNSDDLDYAGRTALGENGGSIAPADPGPFALLLPDPGSLASLGGSKDIAVDTEPPRVESVSSPGGAGAHGAGDTIEILVEFTEPVGVSARGRPALALDTGAAGGAARHAAYAPRADGAAPSADLRFLYTVQPGDGTDRLDYAGTEALSLNGSSISDAAGNPAMLELPFPGLPGSLGDPAAAAISVRGGPAAGAPTPLEAMVAGAAAGATVRVPAGTHEAGVLEVGRPMTIEPADPESPPVLTGRSRIVVTLSAQDGAAAGAAAGPVVIRNLVFENTARAPAAAGAAAGAVPPALITVESAPGAAAAMPPVTIEGNTFRGTCGSAVWAAPSAPGAPPIAGLAIKGNRFYGIGGNCAPGAPVPADAIAAGRHDPSAAAPGAAQLSGMVVEDNYIFGTTHAGIRIAGADGLLVRGNHIEGVPDDGVRILPSRNVQVHLNTIAGANSAPRAAPAHDGAAGAAIEVWSGSDGVAATLNRISGGTGALSVCAGTCDPGPDPAAGAAGSPVPVARTPTSATGADGAAGIRFSHNVIAPSVAGAPVASGAGGVLDARANYYPGHAASAAGRIAAAAAAAAAETTVLHEPALDGAGPVRIGAVVADGAGSPVRSVDAAVRAAFELGVLDFNARQARANGTTGLEPAFYAVGSPDSTASARAGHAAAAAALRSGSSADARALPVLHNSISAAMAVYDAAPGGAALQAIGALASPHAHYPFVVDRSGAVVAHGGARAAGSGAEGGAVLALAGGPGAAAPGAAVRALLDFSAPSGTGVAPGHPGAPWKWWAYDSADPAAGGAAAPKRSVIALHPGPDGALHSADDLVFGAGYRPAPGAAHLVVAAGDAPAAAAAAAPGAVVVSPTSTAARLAEPDALFRLAPPDSKLAGVVLRQVAADRPSSGSAPAAVVALNDSASLQSMGLAGELHGIDYEGALPDGVGRVDVVSYNSSEDGWAPDAAAGIGAAVSAAPGGAAAVVYAGRAGAFAALAESLSAAQQQAGAGGRWYATGELARAELAASGPAAAALARGGQLVVLLQHAAPDAAVDAALAAAAPGYGIALDESTRGPAYAAYDAPGLLGRAVALAPSTSAAAVARAIDEDVARTHDGALGSPLILDRNGDLALPVAYAASAFPAAGGAAWDRLPGLVGERSCGIALAKGALDFGSLALGRHSRPDTQTVINTGTLPYRAVTLAASDWTYPGSAATLPASITELREAGRASEFADIAPGITVAPGLGPGMERDVEFRIDLTAYDSLPRVQVSQTINYLLECSAAG